MSRAASLSACWLALLALGCDDAPPTRSSAVEPAASSDFSNPSSLFQQEAEHQHGAARPARELAPAVVALSQAARARLTSLHISSRKDGVTINKVADAWETAYSPRCLVDATRLEAALDNLATLTRQPTEQRITSGDAFVLRIAAYEGSRKLLKLDIGPGVGPNAEAGAGAAGAQLMQLDDGSTYAVKHWKSELFPADPRAWCKQR